MRIALPLLVGFFLWSCAERQEAKRVQEIESLKGKTMQDVLHVLGAPRVVDSSASAAERIWGYYQVMVRSNGTTKPRQRTVLIVFQKRDSSFIVEEVRIP
jgi:hypothetical protein